MVYLIPDPLFPGLGIDDLIDLPDQLREIKILAGQIHFPGLDFGHVQYIVDQ